MHYRFAPALFILMASASLGIRAAESGPPNTLTASERPAVEAALRRQDLQRLA
jgi:hypothetical protein